MELRRCTGCHDGKLTCLEVLLVRAIHARCSVHVSVAILIPVMRLPNRLAASSAQVLQVGGRPHLHRNPALSQPDPARHHPFSL